MLIDKNIGVEEDKKNLGESILITPLLGMKHLFVDQLSIYRAQLPAGRLVNFSNVIVEQV